MPTRNDDDDDRPVRRRRVVTATREDEDPPRRRRDEDETPRSRTRDDDDDAPRRRTRDDDEDEAPRRRTRDDDEAPPARARRTRDDDEDDAPRRRSKDTNGDRSSAGKIRGGYSAAKQVADSTMGYPMLRPDQQSVLFAFVEPEPFASFRRHWVDRRIDRKNVRRSYFCLESLGDTCPLCDVGDKPTAVSAFNVVEIGDDGMLSPKVLEVGVKYLKVLEDYNNDAKIGPLDKPKKYFMVSKSSGGKSGTTTYSYIPITAATMADEYSIDPPTRREIEGFKRFGTDIFYIHKRKDLEEVAEEASADSNY